MSEGMSEGSAGSASADHAICAEVTASSPHEEGEAQVEVPTIVAFPDHTETEDEEEDQRISDEHEAFVETDDSGRFGRVRSSQTPRHVQALKYWFAAFS
jgi:hypothetical protein